ncbi:MAG: hypothetical protein QF415_05585 [Candidatus Undinarchaeales archaeon]|nr:hypothetical protein [Candidatus Undinarchaeales archaeon]MDP7491946.1 hypothetical protein [Candidatus Undinarchaeales archaeon]
MDIGSLKNRIGELEKQRNDCSKEIDESKGRRDLLNQKIRESAGSIKELRKLRDEANAQVREQKHERARIQKFVNEQRKVMREKRELFQKMMKDAPTRMAPHEIKDTIEKMEFEFQTNAMTLDQEKRFLEKIKKLERTYQVRMKAEDVHQDMMKAGDELDTFREQVEAAHKKVVESSELSQQHHEALIGLSRQMDPMRRDADQAHRSMVVSLERKKEINGQLAEVRKQLLEVKAERQAHDLAEREAALKHKADGIKETLKGKKRFDLRQLQILAQTGEGFSFGGEDGDAVNIEGKRAIKKRKAAEKAESKAKDIPKKAEPKKKAPAKKEEPKAEETPKKAKPKKKEPKAEETPKKAEPKKKAPAKKKVVVKDEPPTEATSIETPLAISEDAQLEEALKVEDI